MIAYAAVNTRNLTRPAGTTITDDILRRQCTQLRKKWADGTDRRSLPSWLGYVVILIPKYALLKASDLGTYGKYHVTRNNRAKNRTTFSGSVQIIFICAHQTSQEIDSSL